MCVCVSNILKDIQKKKKRYTKEKKYLKDIQKKKKKRKKS